MSVQTPLNSMLPTSFGAASFVGQWHNAVHSAWAWTNTIFDKEVPYICQSSYTTEIISIDPLAIYINQFITDWEIDYLLNLAESSGLFEYSEAHDPNRVYAPLRRTSSSAILPDDDLVVQCIDRRAEQFVGFVDHEEFESVQVVKYLDTERHDSHFDWFEYPPQTASGLTCNRASSFFVYLSSDCTGGETFFESLQPAPQDADPVKFSNVNSPDGLGLAVKPKKGNAMFWMNLHANNTGDQRVRHAALPVRTGIKHGMNLLMKRCFT